ncbi:MAG: hypothetical protein ACR2LI_00900 [Propionibacteriaceae bacterium]
MTDPSTEPTAQPMTTDKELPAEEYGTLTAEDENAATVDPADVAGTDDGSSDEPPAR